MDSCPHQPAFHERKKKRKEQIPDTFVSQLFESTLLVQPRSTTDNLWVLSSLPDFGWLFAFVFFFGLCLHVFSFCLVYLTSCNNCTIVTNTLFRIQYHIWWISSHPWFWFTGFFFFTFFLMIDIFEPTFGRVYHRHAYSK